MRVPKTQAELDEIILSAAKEEPAAQIYDELRQVLTVLNLMDVRSMIEVGAESGGSLRVWTKLWDPLALFVVDNASYGCGTREEREAKWRSWLSPTQTLNVTWGDSHATATRSSVLESMVRRGIPQVDLCYIDGDHSEAGVEKDYEMFGSLVRDGGLVLLTDIHPHAQREDQQAHKFWRRLKPVPIPQDAGREPHPRPNWQAFDLYHDKGAQKAFGWGFVFK